MYFHWQNLNDKPGGGQGSGVIHGRAWWRLTNNHQIHWEWVLFSASCGASIRFERSEDVGVHLHVAIPLLMSFYLHLGIPPFTWLTNLLLRGTKRSWEDRELSVRVFDWAVWWTVWRDPMGGWDSSVPKWRDGNFRPLDLLLGKHDYATREIESVETVIPMPERAYKAKVTLFESTWKRPRWFPKRVVRADIDCKDDPIPHPGKGENSYDCDDDATFSMTTGPVRSIEQGIAQMVEYVLVARRKYGGRNWKPETEEAAE